MSLCNDEFLWVEKYRPTTIDECILPVQIKETFKQFVSNKEIPNLLLIGPAGTGKTTVGRALCSEVGCETLFINGSSENGIDVFRNKITNYASTVSFSGGRKVVIIDEADYMNCLEENEEILVGTIDDYDAIKLKDLKQGIEYACLSFNCETKQVESDVLEVVSDSLNDVYEIEFEDGTKILMTNDHPIMCLENNTITEKTVGNILLNYNKVDIINVFFIIVEIKSIKYVGTKRTINVSVKRNNTIISKNGVVTHNCNSLQPALRSGIEAFSHNATFILTANYPAKIITPIHSRCTIVDFKIKKEDKKLMLQNFFKRVCNILEKENIEYNKDVIATLIKKYFPDFRRIINELQRYSVNGSIDVGILSLVNDIQLKDLLKFLKEKDFGSIRTWVNANIDGDITSIYTKLYSGMSNFLEPKSIPSAILLMAKYQYQTSFVTDQEIQFMAFLVELMSECTFKSVGFER